MGKREDTIIEKYGSFSVIGKKAAQTNKRKHGEDFYQRIGKKGGRSGHSGGFKDKELASRAGRIGGKISKRGPAKTPEMLFALDPQVYAVTPKKWWHIW